MVFYLPKILYCKYFVIFFCHLSVYLSIIFSLYIYLFKIYKGNVYI